MASRRFFIQGLLPVALSLAGLPANADPAIVERCSQIRLDSKGGSMEHVRVRDQGSIGNCYSHVAEQMVDAYRFSEGDRDYEHVTSGLEVSLREGLRRWRGRKEHMLSPRDIRRKPDIGEAGMAC